jgi:hypothetical protein
MVTRRRIVWSVLGVVLVVALVLTWPWVRVYTGSAAPEQFYRAVSVPTSTANPNVLAVAHNAGNNPATTARALHYGADVIEIDVITVHGALAAGRAHGFRWLAERVFRGPTLAAAWQHASAARVIKLDLQRDDRVLLRALVGFLHTVSPQRRVMISTRDANAIEYLRPRVGAGVTLLFSVPFPDAVRRVQSDSALQHAIGGISVFQGLVSDALVSWAHEHRLVVLAWTVNDSDGFARLLQRHVDGITTANLAIVRALSG